MFRSHNTIQAHPINQGEPELFYGLSNMTGCSTQEHILHGLLQIHHIVHRFIS